MESLHFGVVWVRTGGVGQASVLADEVWHSQDTTHPTGVVTEEDTTKGGKGTDEVGPHGNGGLEAGRVRRPRNDDGSYSSSRHDGGGMLVEGTLKR